ncbi:hypothetical protein Q3C01_23055 [Bradyrhizobium sp. UFLA05-109]
MTTRNFRQPLVVARLVGNEAKHISIDLNQHRRTRHLVSIGACGDFAVRDLKYLPIATFLLVGGALSDSVPFRSIAKAADETPKDMLAAQIRSQGIVCDKPQRANRIPRDQSRITRSGF